MKSSPGMEYRVRRSLGRASLRCGPLGKDAGISYAILGVLAALLALASAVFVRRGASGGAGNGGNTESTQAGTSLPIYLTAAAVNREHR